MQIVYSRTHHPLMTEGRTFSNPRFFTVPNPDAVKVFIVGNWPEIGEAYRAAGVEVVEVDADKETVNEVEPAPALAPGAAEIPGGWADMSWPELRKLASQVSDEPVTNKEQAVAAIEAELARRTPIEPE